MNCPKCNKEYNTMQEIMDCLSNHIKEEKENEKAARDKKKNAEVEKIKKEFINLATLVENFNKTYPETYINKPVFMSMDKGKRTCNGKLNDFKGWKINFDDKNIEKIDLQDLLNGILW